MNVVTKIVPPQQQARLPTLPRGASAIAKLRKRYPVTDGVIQLNILRRRMETHTSYGVAYSLPASVGPGQDEERYDEAKQFLNDVSPLTGDAVGDYSDAIREALEPVTGHGDEEAIRAVFSGMVKAMPNAANMVTPEYVDALVWANERDEEDSQSRRYGLQGFRAPVILLAVFRVITGVKGFEKGGGRR